MIYKFEHEDSRFRAPRSVIHMYVLIVSLGFFWGKLSIQFGVKLVIKQKKKSKRKNVTIKINMIRMFLA